MDKTITIRNEGREAERKEDIQWRSKAEEYEIISNLTGFDNLRAMIEGEATMKRRKTRRRRRKRNNNNNNINEVDTVVKENKMIETLKVVKRRTEGNGDEAGPNEVIGLCSSSSEDDGLISNITSRKSTGEMVSVEASMNEDNDVAKETVDAGIKEILIIGKAKCVEIVKSPESSANNIVLRKLLRKPRYFDMPISSWGTCFSCGEDHQADAKCVLQKPVKACFLCGSLQHVWKHCTQGQYCFVCKGASHQANDCPGKQEENNLIYMICLRCGDFGHDMFSCRHDYSPDDLKKIRCYICNDYGHLSCVKPPDTSWTEVSCYSCGQSGHSGSACSKSPKVASV